MRRRLTPDMARAVRDLSDPSLSLVEDSLRLYPNRELAAQLVGFEGAEGKGLAGMEQLWDGTWPASRAARWWRATRSAAR